MTKLEDFGFIQSRPRGEYHANNQQMSKLLHQAIGLGGKGSAPQVCLDFVLHCAAGLTPNLCSALSPFVKLACLIPILASLQ